MEKNIAASLEIENALVSVKATTTEYMGFTGRGEGICVVSTVLLERE
jgi:2-C-methyl-D-erythritol 2,4-cyclodiphosphate synthase